MKTPLGLDSELPGGEGSCLLDRLLRLQGSLREDNVKTPSLNPCFFPMAVQVPSQQLGPPCCGSQPSQSTIEEMLRSCCARGINRVYKTTGFQICGLKTIGGYRQDSCVGGSRTWCFVRRLRMARVFLARRSRGMYFCSSQSKASKMRLVAVRATDMNPCDSRHSSNSAHNGRSASSAIPQPRPPTTTHTHTHTHTHKHTQSQQRYANGCSPCPHKRSSGQSACSESAQCTRGQ